MCTLIPCLLSLISSRSQLKACANREQLDRSFVGSSTSISPDFDVLGYLSFAMDVRFQALLKRELALLSEVRVEWCHLRREFGPVR